MNKRILLATGAAVLTLAAMSGIHNANAVTTSGDVEATILQTITLTAVDELDFGSLTPSGVAGTVVISTAGARSFTGGVTLVGGGGENNGTFNLDGADGYTVTVDVPASDTVVSGADSMTVNGFIYSYNAGADNAGDGTAVLAAGGPHVLSMGATLNVAINQPAGQYQGAYDVTVNYQ
jgi:hypothetical protein